MWKKIGGLMVGASFLLTGCQDPQPPVYSYSAVDVMTNTARYLQPVVTSVYGVMSEGFLIADGTGSIATFSRQLQEASQTIDRAKNEISAMAYPPAIAGQKDEAIQDLLKTKADLEQLGQQIQSHSDVRPALERIMGDIVILQKLMEEPQGVAPH